MRLAIEVGQSARSGIGRVGMDAARASTSCRRTCTPTPGAPQRRGADRQPDYAAALLARGRVLLAMKRTAEAVEALERAARLNPLPEYQWTLADALRASGASPAMPNPSSAS